MKVSIVLLQLSGCNEPRPVQIRCAHTAKLFHIEFMGTHVPGEFQLYKESAIICWHTLPHQGLFWPPFSPAPKSWLKQAAEVCYLHLLPRAQ
jgi:hypothetical protein